MQNFLEKNLTLQITSEAIAMNVFVLLLFWGLFVLAIHICSNVICFAAHSPSHFKNARKKIGLISLQGTLQDAIMLILLEYQLVPFL